MSSKKKQVWFLVECWMFDEGFIPVGVWYLIEGQGLDFWFEEEIDRMVEMYDILGPYSRQLANKFAQLSIDGEVDIWDPKLLEDYRKTGGQRIDRVGPFEIEVNEVDLPALIEAARNGEAVPIRDFKRMFKKAEWKGG